MALSIRPFRKSDMPHCAELAMEVWPVVARFLRAQGRTRFMRSYVEIVLMPATWREVVCDGDRVVGYLFGRVEREASPWDAWHQGWQAVHLIIKALLGQYGRLPNPCKFLRNFFATEQKITRFSGPADGEVLLFVVDPICRGRAIGRRLMERFLLHARQAGVRRITLYTDPQSSWRFYEWYGFRRHAAFTDDLDTYLSGAPVQGYIYVLQFPK